MKFSLIVATGRASYGSLIGSPKHLLADTLASLQDQEFKDFELVLVDSLFKKRDLLAEAHALGSWSYQITMTHPRSWWLENRMWALQNAFNEGFRVSRGDYVFFCGDCCEFPPGTLAKASALVDRGYSPSLLCAYRTDGKLMKRAEGCSVASDVATVEDAMKAGIWTDLFIRDSRWNHTQAHKLVPPNKFNWDMFYGYCCVKREDFIHVNGYDENFDGDKALGDVELGSRLHMANRWSPCLSEDLWVYENWHGCLDPDTYRQDIKSVRSNYDLLYLMRQKGIWKANNTVFSEADCRRVINAKVTNLQGWRGYSFTPDEVTYPFQRHWVDNQPQFTL